MSEGRQIQLDTLRACAVLVVVWQHTMRPQFLLTRDAGAIGVVLFFVLSGFLITGILLDARTSAEAAGIRRGGVLRRFYARRFVRIFPLYYGVVLVAWLLGEPQVRESIWWLATYTTNFLMAVRGTNLGMITPFWSLAVEEQFYCFWPLIVLFAPRRMLPWAVGGMVVMSVAARTVLSFHFTAHNTITMPTFATLDALGIGAGLALAVRTPGDHRRLYGWVLALGLATLALRFGLIGINRGTKLTWGLYMLPWALIGAWLVERASRGALPSLFNQRAFGWIGVVSYGVYVYHRPLMSVLHIGSRRGWDIFALVLAVTLVVASASWLLFERPINNLKRRWPYVRRPDVRTVVLSPVPATGERV